jgi:HlyD family secretion protein
MKYPYISFLLLIFFVASCSNNSETDYRVKKGKFEASVTETGDLQAVNARVINMPYVSWWYANDFKVLSLRTHGSQIKKGDTIAVIDNASVLKAFSETQTRLDVEKAALNKLLIQHNTKETEVKSDIAVKEAGYNMAVLQLEKSKFETDKTKKIKKLELERATIALNLAKLSAKTSLSSSKKMINIQRIRIKSFENDLRNIQNDMSVFYIKSPGNGLLQISINRETRQIFKEGDKIRRGDEIACVPDMSKMKVRATINETDIGKIFPNQKVTVRLDAYTVVPFEGTIFTISKICHRKDPDSNIKVFDFEVLLKKTDPLLKPGMTVSCEIFFAQLKDVLYISNNCVQFADSERFVILEKGHKKQPITLGPSNSKFTVVYGDLPVGEKLLPVETDITLKTSKE